VIKGCNSFWAKNWQTVAALWAGALSCNKKKSRQQSRTQQDEPDDCASAGGPVRCCFIEFCIYSFSLRYEFFVHYDLRDEKKLSIWS